MSAPAAKLVLRRRLRAEVAALSPEERARESALLCGRLREQAMWRAARSILFFVPLRDEPDVWPLLLEALAEGRQVVLPRHSFEEDGYVGSLLRDATSDLRPGPFGILEPSSACPTFPLKQLDFALVPGIGFALNGGRLGRGKGYYDRLLTDVPGFKCGVAFGRQVVAELPTEPHDVQLNGILTPTRWHVVSGQARP